MTVEDFKFAAVGDFDDTSQALNVVSKVKAFTPAFLCNLGDFAYTSGSSAVSSWWNKVMVPLAGLKQYPVLGNHDTGDQNDYKSRFGNSSWVYSFSYKNIFFLMLNSESAHSVGSSQYTFAEAELKKAKQNPAAVSAEYAAARVRWIIVCFHEPIFNSSCTHSPKTSFRDAMAPLFDKYHVDLCLSGHNHNYERTNPITFVPTDTSKPKIENDRLNDYIDTFGTIYAVPGSGGRSLYDQNSKQYYVLKQFRGHGFLKLFMEQDGTKLRAEYLGIDGNVKDNFSLVKEGIIVPPPEPCPAGQHRDPTTGLCVDDTVPPPPPEPCPAGQHRDTNGNCVDDTPPPPPPPSGDNDIFGVKKIYPDGAGSSWTMQGDPRTDPRGSGNPETSGSKPNWASAPNADGSWRQNGPSTVRWAIAQNNGFKQSEMSCCTDICEPRGFMQDEMDWKNIEQTAYYRIVKVGTGTANGGVHIEHVMRGQRSTTSNTPNGPGGCAIGCSDNYHFNAYCLTGRLKFERNLFHTSGYSQDITGVQKLTATRKWADNTWFGLKTICYNKPDNSVQLEIWVDENADGNWRKAHEFTDKGQWPAKSTADLGKCHSKPNQVVSWGGPLTTFRNDNMQQLDVKWASIRSITPPGIEPPEPCPDGQHRDPVTGLCVPDTTPPPPPEGEWIERKLVNAVAQGPVDAGNVAMNVLDNTFTTRWSSLGKGVSITTSLEAKATVGLVKVAWYKGDTRKNNFIISVSKDGTTFNDVLTAVSAGNTTNFESYTFAEESDVKAVKITVNGNTANDWASITEIKAFGKGSVTPPPPPPEQWIERKVSSMLNQETLTLTLEQPSKVAMARVLWFEPTFEPSTRQYAYSILVSPDNGVTWEEVATGMSTTQNQEIPFITEQDGITQARIVVTNTITGSPGTNSAFSIIQFKVFGKATDVPPPPPPVDCGAGKHWDEAMQMCVDDIPPTPTDDPIAVIKPDAPTAMPGESLSLDASQSKNAMTYSWSVTQVGNGSVSITSNPNTPTVNVKIGSDATSGGRSTMKLAIANALGKVATAQKDIVVGQLPPPPPPPPPTGNVLFDSNIHGKWNNGRKRTLTTAHEFDPDCNLVEVAAGASRKFEVFGDGTAKITGDRARIYIHVKNYNAQLECTFVPNATFDNNSLKLRSRHGEPDPPENRFGGYGSAVSTYDIDFKREDYHNVHHEIKTVKLAKKMEYGKEYTARFTLKDTANKTVEHVTEIDYGDGQGFVEVARATDTAPKPYMINKGLYLDGNDSSYAWVRCNGPGSGGTPNMLLKRVIIRSLD